MGRRPDNDPLDYRPICWICGESFRDKHDLVKHIIYKTGHLEHVYALQEENKLLKEALEEWRALARKRGSRGGVLT